MWVTLCMIVAFVLLVVSYCNYLANSSNCIESKESRNKQKVVQANLKQETHMHRIGGFLLSEEIRHLIFEVGVVILGATLAIVCTMAFENHETHKRMLDTFATASKDIDTQGSILGELIKKYDSEGDIETLRMNASIDVSIIEGVIYSDDVIGMIPKGPYSTILNHYRSIKNINEYLVSDRSATDEYTIEICNRLLLHLNYLADELDHIIQWKIQNKISDTEYAIWFNEHCLSIQENIAEVSIFMVN